MIQLLSVYSIGEILVFIVILALAVKGVVTFGDWGIERLRRLFNKESQRETDRQQIDKLVENQKDMNEKIERLLNDKNQIDSLISQQNQLTDIVDKITQKIDILIDSDKDAIKSFITDKHHYHCFERGWIDDYSLDCIQRRYSHYREEGGNSFIADLMQEIKELPKQRPPQN